jgi:hypothetical protein
MSEIKEIKVSVEDGVKELVIRHGEASKIHIPNGIELSGCSIQAPKEYLSKKGINPDEIKNSIISYSLENRYIQLVYGFRRENQDKIEGRITLHPDLINFEINAGKRYSPHALADFIRMNRHYFETKDVAIKLEATLRNFTAEVDRKIEAADDKRANIKASIVQTVRTSIPESFVLLLPVFIGAKPIAITVEIDINSSDLSCSLMSPDLKSFIDTEGAAIIESELSEIRVLYPELRIFQK